MPPATQSGVSSISQGSSRSSREPQTGALYRHQTTGSNFNGQELIRVEDVKEGVVLWYSHDGKTIRGETRGAMPLNRFQSECQLEETSA